MVVDLLGAFGAWLRGLKNLYMNRRKWISALLSSLPFALFSKTVKWKINMPPTEGFVVKAGEARFGVHYNMKGVTSNTLDIKISGADTSGSLAVFEQTGLTPNGGPPLHIHPYQDEWFFVMEGKYLFQVGEEKYRITEGDTIFLPRNVPHAFIQLTETGRMIVSYLPAGKMEDFFKTTSLWDSPPSKEEVAQVFEGHDMKIVGPPLRVN